MLQHLIEDDWGLFDDVWDISQLEDAIRDMQPTRIVVDDAHLQGDRLSKLRQLRTQMDANFTIAAVTWPGSVDNVAAIPDADTELFGTLSIQVGWGLVLVTIAGWGGALAGMAIVVRRRNE